MAIASVGGLQYRVISAKSTNLSTAFDANLYSASTPGVSNVVTPGNMLVVNFAILSGTVTMTAVSLAGATTSTGVLLDRHVGTGVTVEVWAVPIPIPNSSDQINLDVTCSTTANNTAVIWCDEYSGTEYTTGNFAEASNGGAAGATNLVSTGTITPSVTGEMLVAAGAWIGTQAKTAGPTNSFTTPGGLDIGTGGAGATSNVRLISAYLLSASTLLQTGPVWTKGTDTRAWAGTVAGIKPFTGSAPSSPGTPTLSDISFDQVKVTFTAASGTVQHYRVESSPAGAGTWTVREYVTAAGTVTIYLPSESTSYDVRVVAVNPAGDTASSTVNFSTTAFQVSQNFEGKTAGDAVTLADGNHHQIDASGDIFDQGGGTYRSTPVAHGTVSLELSGGVAWNTNLWRQTTLPDRRTGYRVRLYKYFSNLPSAGLFTVPLQAYLKDSGCYVIAKISSAGLLSFELGGSASQVFGSTAAGFITTGKWWRFELGVTAWAVGVSASFELRVTGTTDKDQAAADATLTGTFTNALVPTTMDLPSFDTTNVTSYVDDILVTNDGVWIGPVSSGAAPSQPKKLWTPPAARFRAASW